MKSKEQKIGILNTSILTAAGDYSLKDISLAEAREVIAGKEIDSAVGHQSTSDVRGTYQLTGSFSSKKSAKNVLSSS